MSAASARASACLLLAVRCRPLSGDEVRPPPPFSSYENLRSELRLSGEEPALFVPDGEDPPLDFGEVSFVSRFSRARSASKAPEARKRPLCLRFLRWICRIRVRVRVLTLTLTLTLTLILPLPLPLTPTLTLTLTWRKAPKSIAPLPSLSARRKRSWFR